MVNDDEDIRPTWVEVLSRPPIRVTDDTKDEDIQQEFAERLLALLDSHNGLDATAEGWRRLAVELALKHEPAFKIETPVDRTGPSGRGGRPVGWDNFIHRSRMKDEIRRNPGISARAAAKKVARKTKAAAGTLMNAMSRELLPDELSILPYCVVAERAAVLAAVDVSHD